MYVLQKHTLSILNTTTTKTHSNITYSYTLQLLEYTYHFSYITIFPHMPRYSSTRQPSCFTSAHTTTCVVHARPIKNYRWNTITISKLFKPNNGRRKKRALKYEIPASCLWRCCIENIETVPVLHILRIVP